MKRKNILLSIFMAAALASCSDYLDVDKDLKDRITLDEVFTNRDYTEEWLANAYGYLSNSCADMGYGGQWPYAFADDIYHPDYRNLWEKTYLEGQWQDTYKNCYLGIRQASIFIHNIDRSVMFTEAERADFKAQARFVRAFFYWKLLQKYGPIPLIPDDEGQDYMLSYDELYLSRNTYDECVEYISNEMIEAAKILPYRREAFNIARPTKGAALAVRARALLYAASPLMNGKGGNYAASMVNDEGNPLLSTVYDEEKWAKAAAAAKDVMELNRYMGDQKYDLYHQGRRETSDALGAYPATIPPFNDGNFSLKNWPEGYADIDPFASYRAVFNGEAQAWENYEVIFTRGQNQGDSNIKNMVVQQLPTFAKGRNRISMTQKQCDAYYMNDGADCPGKDSEIGRGDGSARLEGFVTADDVAAGRYLPCIEGVSLQYVNREPRFYASVAYNGTHWPLSDAVEEEDRDFDAWYYRDEAERYTGSTSQGLCTGIGVMKFVRPTDTNEGELITDKPDVAIRYAEILLIYAEALNEITPGTQYTVASWDGSTTYTIARSVDELKKGIQPIRIRAGIPDYEDFVYELQDQFRAKLKRERQIELMGEGHRYFDLRRWMDAPTEESVPVYGCNTEMTRAQAAAFHRPVRIDEIETRFTERTYFWPFSIDELYRNRKLTQNPGWQTSK